MDRRGELVVCQLLRSLAPLLLSYGISPDQLASIARRLLVQAAAYGSRLRNGRVNQSQIAASTGLSRADVRKLLSASGRAPEHLMQSKSRSATVLNGWLTDRRFCFALGKPKPLRFYGRGASFANLVKKYGRDVPPRAMAAELTRQGCVKFEKERIALRPSGRQGRAREEREISERLTAIDSIISTIISEPSISPTLPAHFVTIPTSDALELDLVRRRVGGLLEGTAAALSALTINAIGGARSNRKRPTLNLRVALVVSEARNGRRQTRQQREVKRLQPKRV